MWNIIKLSTQRVYLNFKSMVINPLTMVLLILIPFLFCITTTLFAPARYQLGMIIGASIVLVSFVVYGSVAGSFRRSTLNSNLEMTASIKWTDNLATIGTMVIMTFLVLGFNIGLLIIFNKMGILLFGPEGYVNSKYTYNFLNLNYFFIIYNSLLITVITYSIAYLIQGFFDSEMFFFTTAIVFLILLLIFGSTLNQYFIVNGSTGELLYNNYSIMPEGFYIPSLLFPYYAPTQMLQVQGQLLTVHFDVNPKDVYNTFNPWSWQNNIIDFNGGLICDWKWNILWFVPYFHILFWWFIGFGSKAIKKIIK